MDKDYANVVDIILVSIGTAFSLTDLKSIIGIVILCVQLIWITLRVVFAIRDDVKNKDDKSLVEHIKEYGDDLTTIRDSLSDDKKEKETKNDGGQK